MSKQINSWQDLCACGNPKHRYSRECQACHFKNRKDVCPCGKPKLKAKNLCRDCHSKRDQCSCGGIKDKRAKVCTICRQKEPAEKACTKCKAVFPIDTFSLRPDGRGGHKRRSQCPSCESAYAKTRDPKYVYRLKVASERRRRTDPEVDKAYKDATQRRYWRKQGINYDTVVAYADARGWRCEICGVSLEESRMRAIDHDHESGRFRGVLCSLCNKGLGLFKDNPKFLERAVQYLSFSPDSRPPIQS